MKKLMMSLLAAFGLCVLIGVPASACTSYYVGSDLTEDGSVMFGRNEDISSAYDKVLQVIESQEIPEDGMWVDEKGYTEFTAPYYNTSITKTYSYTACRDAEEYGDGLFGEIGVNEMGVAMSATTTAGNSEEAEAADPFTGSTGISEENYVDYILCQASTARQGVEILAQAIDDYGVWYTADGVFISDNTEVWYFEILSGHQYCAIRMPDDKAALIPNCLVIGDADLDDTENVIASEGIVTVAQEGDIYVEAQENPEVNDINVKLTYAGEGYSSANADRIRAGQYILTGVDNTDIYTDAYQDIFFVPSEKVTIEKLYQLAGSQYEEYTEAGIDFTEARPETASSSIRYIGVAASYECHIIQIRKDMPAELATVEWLSLSSAAYAPMVPFYGALLTDVADSYKEEAPDYTDTSAYWTYQKLGKYLRSDADDTLKKAVKSFYQGYVSKLVDDQVSVDEQLLDIYYNDPTSLSQTATDLGISIGTQTVALAQDLYEEVTSGTALKFETSYDDVTYAVEDSQADSTTAASGSTETSAATTAKPAKVTIKKIKNVKNRKIQIKFKKVSGATGYEIAYSINVNFTKKKTTVKTVSSSKNVRTLKSLKKGKTYYVKVRAYKKVGNTKVYGSWSKVKVVKVTK
ncbi:MAG: C69 family dipeptidase [Clostridiales bacterium]|nr:C69 family dipeptidase [Clostridiales bacterium]